MHRLTFHSFLVLAAMLIFCAPISRAKAKDIAFLEAAGKPQGVLLNVLAPIVEELVKSEFKHE